MRDPSEYMIRLVSESEISLSSFWCSSSVLGFSFSLSFPSSRIWIVGFIFTQPLKDSAVLLQGGVRNGCIRSCLGSVFLAISKRGEVLLCCGLVCRL